MNRRDFTLSGLVVWLATLLGYRARATPIPAGPPEERDFGGMGRLIMISVPANASPYWPNLYITDHAGQPIELVTNLELAVDARDMLFKGHLTRVARDEVRRDDRGVVVGFSPGGAQKLVREPVVVGRFDIVPPGPRS